MSHLARVRRAAVFGTLAIATTLTACQDSPSPLGPSSDALAAKGGGGGKPGTAERVLFSGTKGGNTDIYIMNPDGSNMRRITTDPGADAFPDFAPDNRKLVWARSTADGNSELFTGNVDGSKQTQLTTLGTTIVQPRYSPDGKRIAFAALVSGHGFEIYTVNADGSGLTRITYETSDEKSPTWSPDGQRIAFESDRSSLPSIYSMTAGGLDVQIVIACFQEGCGNPAYSPDGKRIAATDIGNGSIFVVDIALASSTGVGPALSAGSSVHPTWTKDGTQVVFASNRGIENTFELYVGTPGQFEPSSVRRLTVFAPGQAQTPTFSH